jgi:hypothetical protein
MVVLCGMPRPDDPAGGRSRGDGPMINVLITRARNMLALSFIASASIMLAAPLPAAAAGPQVAPLFDLKTGKGFQLGSVADLLSNNPKTIQLGVFAVAPSGTQLGCTVFGGTQIVKVTWDFGGGAPATNLDYFSYTPTVTFPNRGVPVRYTVRATVYDNHNCDSTTVTFTVTSYPDIR